MAKKQLFLGVPTYDSQLTVGAAMGAICWPTRNLECRLSITMNSLLCHGFNGLWCNALNARKSDNGVDYFAMLHADVEPAEWWVDTLIAEMERTGAKLMSAVIPIKSMQGLTSTAIDLKDDKSMMPRRITMKEIMELPETFTQKDLAAAGFPDAPLLLNTGCWVCDFREPWVEDVIFRIKDTIGVDGEGNFRAIADPEDWELSRQLNKLGVPIAATRKVKIKHIGKFGWGNEWNWGEWDTDQTFASQERMLKSIEELPEDWKYPKDIPGWLTEDEARSLAILAKDKRILEIGAYCGRSTISMAQTASSICTVDTFDGRGTHFVNVGTYDKFKANVNRYGFGDKIKEYIGLSSDIIPNLDGDFDMAFIDGSHDVKSIGQDSLLASMKLKPDGFLVFHDYGSIQDMQVKRFVDKIVEEGAELVDVRGTLAIVRQGK